MIKIPVSLLVAVPMLFALSACEVSTCEGEECDFDSVFDEDAGANNGGSTDGGDGDGGGMDGGADTDGGSGGKADGGSTGEAITIEEFCAAQLAVGTAWADKIDDCCEGSDATEARAFVEQVLIYPPAALETCVSLRSKPVDAGRVEFEPTKALECAQAFAAAYAPPPDADSGACVGYDLLALEGMIGHGAPALKQIPACRQAFAGTVLSGKPCTDSFECTGNLRCRPFSGSGTTNNACQSALGAGGQCTVSNDCDDGLTCVGNSEGVGRQCLAKNDLSFAGNCSRSSECAEGRVCEAGTCAPATGGVAICKAP